MTYMKYHIPSVLSSPLSVNVSLLAILSMSTNQQILQVIQDIVSILPPSISHTNLLIEVITTLCSHIRKHEFHVNLFLPDLFSFSNSLCESHHLVLPRL